jgi:hypothetical protein
MSASSWAIVVERVDSAPMLMRKALKKPYE